MLILFVVCVILYKWYPLRFKIDLIQDPDILVGPGGILGYYVLGICHFIKNNYDIKDKKIIGFSAGSLNTLFLSLDTTHDHSFLRSLFRLNLSCTMYLPSLLKKTIQLMHDTLDLSMFDTTNKYIAVSNYTRLVGYNEFLTLKDMTDCCISSSFIPFITYSDLFYIYRGKSCVDSGVLYPSYKRNIKHKKILYLNYKLFKRFNPHDIPGYGLMHKQYTIYDMYLLGYSDATRNKSLLDDYF